MLIGAAMSGATGVAQDSKPSMPAVEMKTTPSSSTAAPTVVEEDPAVSYVSVEEAMPGWYLSFSGGWQHRETVREAGAPTTFIIFDNGFGLNGALGHRFGNFRVEGETSFLNNEVNIAGAAGFQSPGPGNVNLIAFMLNLYQDIPIANSQWKAYIGGGLGVYQSELNSLRPDFFAAIPPAFGGPFAPLNTKSNFPFAYQFRAGAAYQVNERTEAFAGYRYFHGEKLTFSALPFNTFHPEGADNHAIEVGVRIGF